MKAERYLTRATRGLWGRHKREARQELSSHIFERTRQLMVLGLSEAEAQHRVLNELGEPEAVNAGLLRVHTLPYAVPALALALLAGGAGLMATRAAAQVRINVPVYTTEADGFYDPTAVYIKLGTLRTAFFKAGIKLSGPDDRPTLSADTLKTVSIRLGFLGHGTYDAKQSGELYDGFNFTTQQYERYIDVTAIARWAADAGWPVKVSGWNKPELIIGPALLTFNGTQTAAHLYTNEARTRLFGGICASKDISVKAASVIFPGFGGISGYKDLTLARTPAQPGGIYALAMPYHSEAMEAQRFDNFYLTIAQAGPDGRLTFKMPAVAKHLRFATNINDTAPDLARIRAEKPTYQDASVRGTAILFPLNGSNAISSCRSALTPLNFTGTTDSR